MQLVDREIRESINEGSIRITPYRKEQIKPNSYDVRLSDNFVTYDTDNLDWEVLIDPYDKESIEHETCRYIGDTFIIDPHQFVLACTIEHLELDAFHCAQLAGKSSIARMGLIIESAGFIDSGFEGTLTLELFNANCRPIKLYAGMDIGQLVFTKTSGSCKPYGERSHSKYQNQRWPELSRYYKNEKPYMRVNHV